MTDSFPKDSTDIGTILGVWAHPDDEAYLAGGLMAAAVQANRRVVCVTATRGERGFPDDDPRSLDELAALRTGELERCLAELGVTEHSWLGLPDGACDSVGDDEMAASLAALIDDVRPDTVLTFGPDGMTGHIDHIAVGRWTWLAVARCEHEPRLLFATKTPEWNSRMLGVIDADQVMIGDAELPSTPGDQLALWTVLDEDLAAVKVRALRCQASQVDALIEQGGIEAFDALIREEFFRAPTTQDFSDVRR